MTRPRGSPVARAFRQPLTVVSPYQRRAVRHALAAVGLLALPYVVLVNASHSIWGFDAYAYWSIDLDDLYGRSLQNTSGFGAFRYTPAIAQLFSGFDLVPWEVFLGLWFSAMVVALVWLTRRDALALVAFPPLALELYHANVHLFMAAAIVLGFRYPAAWGFVALCKVTPAVGVLWFAVRREWRSFGVAVGVTLAAAGISLLVAPNLWWDYAATMVDNLLFDRGRPYPIPVPLPIRLAVAIALVVWAARTDRRWVVPVASTIALPIIWWHGLSVLLAAIPLWRADRDRAGRLGRGRYETGTAAGLGLAARSGTLAEAPNAATTSAAPATSPRSV